MNLILFNQDLRINDHQPLAEAVKMGEVLPLYIHEPSVWSGPGLSVRHFQFVYEGLEDLSRQFTARGGKLFFFIGEVDAVLDTLLETYGSITVFTHHSATSSKVQRWADRNNQNYMAYGMEFQKIIARGFKTHWESYMKIALVEPPKNIQVPEVIPDVLFREMKKFQQVALKGNRIRFGQQGGEQNAVETLETFLEERFLQYIANSKKPIPSSLSSSRLSAYITWGNISERFIYQKTSEKLERISGQEKDQLESFLAKLYARGKICGESRRNLNYTSMKYAQDSSHDELFEKWLNGNSGIPFMDAAMRCLQKSGWLNFTLRGMAASFACNTLKLDSTLVSMSLAGLFLDYQPELHEYFIKEHIGANKGKLKLVNPIQMGKKLDPDGISIKRFVPELTELPREYIHEPWRYPGFYQLGYAAPLLDVMKANKRVKAELENTLMKKKDVPQLLKEGDTEQLTFDF
jgi:deoxyribodipyrimidine photo-lyase